MAIVFSADSIVLGAHHRISCSIYLSREYILPQSGGGRTVQLWKQIKKK